MDAKEATFKFLDQQTDGSMWAGSVLKSNAEWHGVDLHYPSTYLRYMREYRQTHDCKIVCVNKRKSLYRMER